MKHNHVCLYCRKQYKCYRDSCLEVFHPSSEYKSVCDSCFERISRGDLEQHFRSPFMGEGIHK